MTAPTRNNADLAARRAAAVPRGVGHATTLYAGRAENAELWDADGNRFIDFAGGIAVLNTGHRHPKVQAAALAQMNAFTHTAFQVVPYEAYIALAERINALAPIDGPAKTVFLTTGAEAVENAVKIARAHTKRDGIIAFTGGFHGRTALTSALTGKVVPYKKDLGPQQPGVHHLPFPTEGSGIDVDMTLKMLDYLFKADIAPDAVAAIIIEPVQGEGGFLITPPELMQALRAKCDEHGILLIADEVQTGFGRTGKLFAMGHYDIKPDLMTMAKSLAGGYPLSGVVGRAEVMDAPVPGGLGGTYGGNPVACAAALAVLDVIEDRKAARRRQCPGRQNEGPPRSPVATQRHRADGQYPRPRRHDRVRHRHRARHPHARCRHRQGGLHESAGQRPHPAVVRRPCQYHPPAGAP